MGYCEIDHIDHIGIGEKLAPIPGLVIGKRWFLIFCPLLHVSPSFRESRWDLFTPLSANPRVPEGILLPVASAVRYMMYALLQPGLPTKPGEKKNIAASYSSYHWPCWLLVAGCRCDLYRVALHLQLGMCTKRRSPSTGQWRTDVPMMFKWAGYPNSRVVYNSYWTILSKWKI